MNNLYIGISYHSVRGGVNNLQIAKIYTPSPDKKVMNVLKTFSSKKMKAEQRAIEYIKKISK